MPTLVITKTYADGDTLFEIDLDNIKNDLEGFLNVTKINDDNIQSAGITGSTKLIDGTVSSAKIASGAVTSSKIADDAVTTAKILAANVTTAKIADANITTAKLADASVTSAKRSATNSLLTGSSGTFSSASTSFGVITNLSGSFTTTGRIIQISLVGDGAGLGPKFLDTGSGGSAIVQVLRDSTVLNSYSVEPGGASQTIVPIIDTPAAGTYTYSVEGKVSTATDVLYFRYFKLSVIEIG